MIQKIDTPKLLKIILPFTLVKKSDEKKYYDEYIKSTATHGRPTDAHWITRQQSHLLLKHIGLSFIMAHRILKSDKESS